jgi:hypothetical protein
LFLSVIETTRLEILRSALTRLETPNTCFQVISQDPRCSNGCVK